MSRGISLGGISSGMDTASIIEQLMSLERVPLNNLKAKQSAHAGRMTSIGAVKDLITSLQTAAKSLTERSKMNAKSAVTDTPSSSPTVLTASAGADAINGSFKVTVKQLATSTRVSSGTAIGSPIDANATLANAGFRFIPSYGTFRVNGEAITVDETTTLNDLVADIDAIDGLNATLVADADGRPNNRIRIGFG